jgi:large subunit ribosomal protein L13
MLHQCRFVIDAQGQRLGRLASLVAKYLRGKHSPTYTPSMDMGAMVIVVNAGQVMLTGRKEDQKVYKRHVNGLPGSMKVESFKDLRERFPEKIIEKAVWGMMPKGRLGRTIKLNMKVRVALD